MHLQTKIAAVHTPLALSHLARSSPAHRTCHQDAIAGTRKLLRVGSVSVPTRSLTPTQYGSHVSAFLAEGYLRSSGFVLSEALAVMYGAVQALFSPLSLW